MKKYSSTPVSTGNDYDSILRLAAENIDAAENGIKKALKYWGSIFNRDERENFINDCRQDAYIRFCERSARKFNPAVHNIKAWMCECGYHEALDQIHKLTTTKKILVVNEKCDPSSEDYLVEKTVSVPRSVNYDFGRDRYDCDDDPASEACSWLRRGEKSQLIDLSWDLVDSLECETIRREKLQGRCWDEAMGMLSPKDRRLVEMSLDKDRSVEEKALAAGMTYGSFRTATCRARKCFSENLQELHYIDVDEYSDDLLWCSD